MLILSRKEGQRIMLGHNIELTVVRIDGDKVRLGLIAPDEVKILRGELKPILQGERDGNGHAAA